MNFDIIRDFSPQDNDRKRKTAKSIKTDVQIKAKGNCQKCRRYVGPLGEVHHKDGNRTNDKLSNLEFLCSNCHKKKTHKQQVQNALKKDKAIKSKAKDSASQFSNAMECPNLNTLSFSVPKRRRNSGIF